MSLDGQRMRQAYFSTRTWFVDVVDNGAVVCMCVRVCVGVDVSGMA